MSDVFASQPLYATTDLPGCGGTIKRTNLDFQVEEIPAYEPSGEGEHLFLWLEKDGLTTDRLIHHVASSLGIAVRDIGAAGLKDARAVTRQYLSVPKVAEPKLAQIDSDRVRLLRARRHGNKLKTGHLKGNAFCIVVRDVALEGERLQSHLDAICSRLQTFGLPNFYGEQRFGYDGSTLQLGLALLRDEPTQTLMHSVPPSRRGSLRRLALSSVQSALFNTYLNDRLRDGLMHVALPGDLFEVCASHGIFVEPNHNETLQARVDAREIVPTGPMFGSTMRQPLYAALEREQRLLALSGLESGRFAAFGNLMQGTRRPLYIWLDTISARVLPPDEGQPDTGAFELRFNLPRGVYATVLLDEFIKARQGEQIAM